VLDIASDEFAVEDAPRIVPKQAVVCALSEDLATASAREIFATSLLKVFDADVFKLCGNVYHFRS